jgi:osmotically inducible protein OsmC
LKVLYTAEATATGGRDGRARTPEGNLDLSLKPPKELGGPGGQPTNPEQLFAAGYGACFLSAVSLIARMQKISAKEFSVTAKVDLGQTDDGGFGIQAALHCELPGVDPDKAEELVWAAYGACPYSKATRGSMVTALFCGEKRLELREPVA